jgi:hypothetical protein
MNKAMVHKQLAFIGSDRVYFGTTRGFHQETLDQDAKRIASDRPSFFPKTMDEYLADSKARGHEQFWIGLEGTVISSKAYYAEQDKIDATRERLKVGDVVIMDGLSFRIENAANHNYKLVEVPAVAALSWAERICRLKALTDDPHPGLASWSKMFADEMNALCAAWAGPAITEPVAVPAYSREYLSQTTLCDICGVAEDHCECKGDEEDEEQHPDTDSLEDRGIELGSYGS